jgi:DNA (cytosine-5)-methyltransferase 1
VNDFKFPQPTNKQIKLRDCLESGKKTNSLVIERDDIVLKEVKINKNIFNEYPLRPIRVGTLNGGGQGERIYSDLGHAITFSAYGGGAGSKTGAYLINNRVRKLSPRECARVMGFPEDYKIHENKNQAYKQFGNSVVVPVLKKIFGQTIKTLDKQYG